MSLTITPSDAEYVVLFNASEESYLHEIPGELRRLLPDSQDLKTLSQRLVLTLLQVALFASMMTPAILSRFINRKRKS